MSNALLNINREVKKVFATNAISDSAFSEQEITDHFLDTINSFKKGLIEVADNYRQLDRLYSKLTWNGEHSDENDTAIRELLEIAKTEHRKTLVKYIKTKKAFWKKNIARKELTDLKYALDDFEETFFEVEEIFFSLRKDDEFNELMDSISF